MKIIGLVGLVTLSFCSLVACGSDGGSDVAGGSGSGNTPPGGSGSPGQYAARLATAADLPPCNDSNDGFLYYLSDVSEFRACVDGAYQTIELTGTDGIDGADGARGADGADGQPGTDGANGQPGTDGADGTDGTDGADGIDGDDGVDGATWLSGEGAPSNTIGVNGDFYLDTESGTLYQKAVGVWSPSLTLAVPNNTLAGLAWEVWDDGTSTAVLLANTPSLVSASADAAQNESAGLRFFWHPLGAGVNLTGFDRLRFVASISSGDEVSISLFSSGGFAGCNVNILGTGAAQEYELLFSAFTACYQNAGAPAFDFEAASGVAFSTPVVTAGSFTITLTAIEFANN
jgi:hypothetical protein